MKLRTLQEQGIASWLGARAFWGEEFVNSIQNQTDLLKEGIIWGEEFVNCIQHDRPYAVWNTSDRTIRAVSKVEAFELLDRDLKNLYDEKAIMEEKVIRVVQSRFRKRRDARRDAQAYTQEQTLTGDHQLTAPEIVV